MRRSLPEAAILAIAASVSCVAAEPAVVLEVEAESAARLQPPLVAREGRGASGGKVLYADPDLWHKPDRFVAIEPKEGLVGGVGLAEYEIRVPTSAAYCAWFRCWYLHSGDDSFYVRVDGGPWSVVSEQKQFEWRWIRGPVLTLSAGTHRLQIAGREDNSIMDKFVLSARPGYVPAEEAERLGAVEDLAVPVPTGPGLPEQNVTFLSHFDRADSADAALARGDPRVGGMHLELAQPGRFGKGVLISHPKAYMLILGDSNAPGDACTLDFWFKAEPGAGLFADGKERYLVSVLFHSWLYIKQGPVAQHRRAGKDQLFVVLDAKTKQLVLRTWSAARNERLDMLSLGVAQADPTDWHHVALSWEKATGRFWLALDGTARTRAARRAWDFQPVLGLYVGSAIHYSVLEPIQGTVDELRVRRGALSALIPK